MSSCNFLSLFPEMGGKGGCKPVFFFVSMVTMSAIPTQEPTTVTAGDTIQWQIALPDYPATDGWTLKYALRGSAGVINITSTASGADHLVTVAAATSALWAHGTYQFTRYVEKGVAETLERATLDSGTITVERNWAAVTTAVDTRSHVKKVLDAIEAVLEGRASRSDAEYEVDTGNGRRRLKSVPVAELIALHSRYKILYQQELAAAGISVNGRKLRVRL